jgi:hypothetical protein
LIDGAWKAQKNKAGPTGKTAMTTLDIPEVTGYRLA